MFTEARRLNLIEKVLKVKNESILIALENVLNSSKPEETKKSIHDFVGFLSKKEADNMRTAIAESCENIDENDWK
ncbi:hypothetical protein [Desertivirga xinjiangensis]|uniref:hypothetical protein n=1 Tax=Desertivirga xinjiangensis TaxID=539206 RepID=UPI00210A88A3|nr:hypothetical protein [Pedobacter xinjiangensis]